jgi:hypothetical protein
MKVSINASNVRWQILSQRRHRVRFGDGGGASESGGAVRDRFLILLE